MSQFLTTNVALAELARTLRDLSELVRRGKSPLGPEEDFELARADEFKHYIRVLNALAGVAESVPTMQGGDNNAMRNDIGQLRIQLAACGVAALGYATGQNAVSKGDWAWSASLGDVLSLRERYDKAEARVAELERFVAEFRAAFRLECGGDPDTIQPGDVEAKFKNVRARMDRHAERISRLREAIRPILTAKFETKTEPNHHDMVELGAAFLGFEFDDLHHAPACPANHYHKCRVPTGPCNCGARAMAQKEAADATGS